MSKTPDSLVKTLFSAPNHIKTLKFIGLIKATRLPFWKFKKLAHLLTLLKTT
jgi:hypothetical protein